jgi:hypothetical protein
MKTVFDTRTESTSDTWLTPPQIIRSLGEFDLDPAAPIHRPWPTAKTHFTIEDNGLVKPWFGRVWLNPPYGNKAILFIERLSKHGNGIAFIYTRVETAMFFKYIWNLADAIFFFRGRVACHKADGGLNSSPPASNCLVAYGRDNAAAIKKSGLCGVYIGAREIMEAGETAYNTGSTQAGVPASAHA